MSEQLLRYFSKITSNNFGVDIGRRTDCLKSASGEVRQERGAMAVPASGGETLAKLQALASYLDAAQLLADELGQHIRELVQSDAVITAALAQMVAAYDARDGHLGDRQKTLGTWPCWSTRSWLQPRIF